MIYRKADKWIDDHFRNTKKALLLTGARQVGKTYAVRRAAERLGWHLVEMNFLLQPETINIVKGAGDLKEVLLRISAYANQPLDWEKTLIFFDEVEEYPDVMTWVKAFVDKGYHLALSGSLLGVELNNVRSVPVGYMDEKQMYPCDFEEFIRAVGVQDAVIGSLREAWEERKPVDAYVHQKMMQLVNLYLLVGGMPAVVQTYLDTNDMQRVLMEQRSILALYKKDIGRYDPEAKLYINDIFDLIPHPKNMDDKNRDLIPNDLKLAFKFSRLENSLTWLRDADMVLPTHYAMEPVVPLVMSKDINKFRLFQNDVGLLACQYADGIQLRILQGEPNINFVIKDYVACFDANFVAQELHAHGWSLYFSKSELGFMLERDTEIIPLLVTRSSNSLYGAVKDFIKRRREAIVLCNDNLSTLGNVTYAPIYMLMFIEKQKDEGPKIYKLDLGELV